MEIEITKTENGYHSKNVETGKEWCFENAGTLLTWLKSFLPETLGDERRLTD